MWDWVNVFIQGRRHGVRTQGPEFDPELSLCSLSTDTGFSTSFHQPN